MSKMVFQGNYSDRKHALTFYHMELVLLGYVIQGKDMDKGLPPAV